MGSRHNIARAEDHGLALTWTDVVLSSMGTLAVGYLTIRARWVPGFGSSVLFFTLVAVGPPLLRWLACRAPRRRVFQLLATFWLLPVAVFGHGQLQPIVDAVQPKLLDKYLAYADLKLFGAHPSLVFETLVPPWLIELLLLCYYTYYVWPFALGVYFFLRGQRGELNELTLALALVFSVNWIFYALVPAVGPRFFLANEFQGPLRGLWLTPLLDSLMRGPAFLRDCFPSGHTAVTLTVLVYAYTHARRFFYVMAPIAAGLVISTVVCRFHYAVDLLAAVPLVLFAISTTSALARNRPRGVTVPTTFNVREPQQA